MPALSSTLLFNTIVSRNETLDTAIALASNATNVTSPDQVIQVVCAWPVSGQYGPGSRVLYYVLVAACVFARKAEWLRNACLAAALIFPAVAALHGIVLAAAHVDNAVDMDIFGAFQFCSIGILAAPLSVRISRTYFENPGRNIIFLWTGIVLAGLLSLTVEFFRTTTSPCTHDDSGNPITPNDYVHFPYENAFCNLTCSTDQGPFSPLRRNATNEIYVIPAPNRLAFNAVTLLAAACCIPAVLSLASMWNKILEINWKSRFGPAKEDQVIEGTNGATYAGMSKVNFMWAPLVGTGLAALGSLYMLLAVDLDAARREADMKDPVHHCNCAHHNFDEHFNPLPRPEADSLHSEDADSRHGIVVTHSEYRLRDSPSLQEMNGGLFISSSPSITTPSPAHIRSSSSHGGEEIPPEVSVTDHPSETDIGNRRRVYDVFVKVSNYLGTASADQFDDSEFKHGKAIDFPEIPAEDIRNPKLNRIRETYNSHHNEDEGTSIRPSRAGSFAGSIASAYSFEGSPVMSRAISAPHAPSRSSSPSPSTRGVRHTNTLPAGQSSFDPQSPDPSTFIAQTRQRRDTLEVPVVHPGSSRAMQASSPVTSVTTITNSQGSPAIVISPDPDTSSSVEDVPVLGPPITQSNEADPPPQPKASPHHERDAP
ncbi:hypothetical protein F5Y11DRAFT_366451 [Daldinia sp. FL1419]|nr:hypothetical protein F5Y11DRAFT_366451 [Daldinia sp. FL1419]